MNSDSKIPLARPVIGSLVERHLGLLVNDMADLTDGMYNAAYRLSLSDGSRVVLKVAPPDDAPRLRYEHGLMRSEVSFYRHARGRAPVPAVLASDFSRQVADRDIVILSFLEGGPLNRVSGSLTSAGRVAVRSQLGEAAAQLHAVKGSSFGYERPTDGLALSGSSWGEAFQRMWDAAVSDIDRYRVRTDVPTADLRAVIRGHLGLLNEVDEPALVHFDLWDGNVFACADGHTARLSGIIDGERMFWGDPLADFVATSLFRDPADDAEFNAGYARAGGTRWEFDEQQRTRLALYTAYLCMLMLAEAVPRGYSGPTVDADQRFVADRLHESLRLLR